jgi:hypothetical protein
MVLFYDDTIISKLKKLIFIQKKLKKIKTRIKNNKNYNLKIDKHNFILLSLSSFSAYTVL